MKTTKQGIIGALTLLLASAAPTLAIEGLKIAVVCPDVVLSWPSTSTNGETYIVQYRPTLDTNDTWVTLTNSLPATSGTNWTSFVHSNMVDCPPGQIFGMMSSGGGSGESSLLDSASEQDDSKTTEPMVMPKDESSPPTPLQIYPPGVDLSGWIILWPDGSTTEWSKEFAEKYAEAQVGGQDGPQQDSGGGGSPSCGFYRVVRYGPSLFGITNGMTLSGTVTVPIELGGTNSEVVGFTLYVDGGPAAMSQIETNSSGQWIATWDTSSIANGSHIVNLEASYIVEDYATDGPLEGVSRTVTIDNGIIFPQPNSVFFGDLVWFYFETKWAAVDYQIDLFINTNTYIGSFTNYITNGVESFYWYPEGDGFTNDQFRCEFYVQEHSGTGPGGNGPAGAGGSAQNTNRWLSKEANYSDPGCMVVAWASPTGSPTIDLRAEKMVRNGVLNVAPYNFNPPNDPNSLAVQLTAGNKATILGHFGDPDYRYCYIFSHGDQNSFGPFMNPPATISRLEIIKATTNWLYATPPVVWHPFKFVWIDGCETAKGKMCEAFGIPVGQYDNLYFNTPTGVNRHSRAFLGAYENYTYSYNNMDTIRANMLANFWADWVANKPLWQCASNAAAYPNDPLKFWRIHGATNLTISTY